jgi:autotransporter strand-loop-strand O-heptosyltransferase
VKLNPLVLKEAVSYKKPLLMRNLSVYDNSYNEYASYLMGNIQSDCLKLHSMLTNPLQIKYNFSELKQMGVEMVKFYESINDIKKEDTKIHAPISFSAQFLDGAFVEIIGESDGTNYNIQFIDNSTNDIKHESLLPVYHWSKTTIKYYVDWKIKIISDNPKYREIEYKIDLYNKIVHISFESSSLGDTIAWIPYVEEFRKKHNCILYCSTFHNQLFVNKYFNINFIQPGETVFNSYAKYTLGWFYENNELDRSSHKSHFVNQPLQKTASDILGLEYREIRPDINTFKYNGNLPDKYFTFSIQSTAQSKYWNYPNGWYELVDMLKSNGYIGVCVDQHTTFGIDGFMNKIPTNCIDKTGLSLEDTIGIIDGAEFHIGLSSGLSWLAWALDKKVVMISGFTDPILEFTQNCIRIHDDTVCNGCFTNPSYKFDKSDWLWCPVHRGTDRQFECSKVITPSHVFDKMKERRLIY